jgi:hypothetical protein
VDAGWKSDDRCVIGGCRDCKLGTENWELKTGRGARRNWWQTLLVGVVCGGVMDLLSGHADRDPGRRSPRLGILGLYYACP